MSSARMLFEQFKSEGINLLRRAKDEDWEENNILEFKTVGGDTAPMKKDDRKNLSIALSGFANSEGGVIVWGIDARCPGKGEPDVARKLRPIRKLKLLCSDLQGLTPQLVSPGISGVEHFPIADTAESDSGFAVTYIPESEANTHMATGPSLHRFYCRTGGSFLKMPQYMIADRFGRRARPRLRLDHRLERGSVSSRTGYRVNVVVGLRNEGNGIALYPAIALHEARVVGLSSHGLDGNGRTGLPERPGSRREDRRIFAGSSDHAIHPGVTLDVTCITRDVKTEQERCPPIRFKYEIFCDGFSSGPEEVEIPMQDFVRGWRGF